MSDASSVRNQPVVVMILGLLVVLGIFFAIRMWPSSSTPSSSGLSPTPSTTPQQVTITGEVVCLPHKDQTGPQTLECAFGIKEENGPYYGISDPQMKYVPSLPTGKKVVITGMLRNNQNDPSNKYDTVGVIEVSSVSSP
jgi:hypothetical protein